MTSGNRNFNVPKHLFYQLFLVMAYLDGEGYPAAFALLGDETAATYQLMWQHLREAMMKPLPPDTTWSPAPTCYHTTNYQCAAYKEFLKIFPEVEPDGSCQVRPKRCQFRKLPADAAFSEVFDVLKIKEYMTDWQRYEDILRLPYRGIQANPHCKNVVRPPFGREGSRMNSSILDCFMFY